ncbi:MAG: hypothetical protein DMF61_23175 [Blastocatellia bacterium AA13]|nr:MAG: hypothetical protein DMF61_23175 [Blastocatellia bacterium AA13]
MIETLLIDDEELPRRELRQILSGEADINIVGEASNGLQAVERITEIRPKLVFLDIEMPGLNGFEVVNSLGYLPFVVFVTAYDQYAIQAFEMNAVDYLLKPVTPERVQKTLARVRQSLEAADASHATALHQLVAAVRRGSTGYISRIAVHKGQRTVLVSLRDIVYIGMEDKLVFVYTSSDRYLINRTISELEQSLEGEGFFRINRSSLVNLEYLAEIIPWFSGTCKLKLADGRELPLSRERVPRLKELVGILKHGSGA